MVAGSDLERKVEAQGNHVAVGSFVSIDSKQQILEDGCTSFNTVSTFCDR